MTPVVPSVYLTDIFTDDENKRLFDVLRTRGPWRLIAGIYFKSTEELLAVSGGAGDSAEMDLSDLLTPAFRGFLGNNGSAITGLCTRKQSTRSFTVGNCSIW